MAPPLPQEPPPEGSTDSLPSTPDLLLSPDAADYKVAPLAGIEGLDLHDESSSESVTPDMDAQVLFVKLKEVTYLFCPVKNICFWTWLKSGAKSNLARKVAAHSEGVARVCGRHDNSGSGTGGVCGTLHSDPEAWLCRKGNGLCSHLVLATRASHSLLVATFVRGEVTC